MIDTTIDLPDAPPIAIARKFTPAEPLTVPLAEAAPPAPADWPPEASPPAPPVARLTAARSVADWAMVRLLVARPPAPPRP